MLTVFQSVIKRVISRLKFAKEQLTLIKKAALDPIEPEEKSVSTAEEGTIQHTLLKFWDFMDEDCTANRDAYSHQEQNELLQQFMNGMFNNQRAFKYIVTIHPKFWEDKFGRYEWSKWSLQQKREHTAETYDKINNWLRSGNKDYQSLFSGGFTENGKFMPYITLQPVYSNRSHLLKEYTAEAE